MLEPTYFEPDRDDLPLPLIRVNPNIVAETTLVESESPTSASAQQRLIFQTLSQVLSPLGVRFEFSIAHRPQIQAFTDDGEHTVLQSIDLCLQPLEYRLWVRCHSPKSLDCELLAEPLARTLRSINLEGFQDAIVQCSRFSAPVGTQNADWRLKIDLTPPIVRLKNWARWGDVQAITNLLNLALAPESIQVSAVLKNLTLQIFCTLKNPQLGKFPTKKIVLDLIAPLLISLTPQGIQGATIHGLQSPANLDRQDEPPVWVYWLDLPGLGDPKYSPTPIILAARGDRDALNFILERLLNPDLERCFTIGGIGLDLMYRQDLIHVMSEAPICPIQSQVATTVIKVVKQLKLPGIRGVRVHGRISGQSISNWTDGVDFDRSPLELPPVAPEHQFEVEPSVPKIGLGQKISNSLAATGIWKHQFTMAKNSQLFYQPRFRWEPSLLLLLLGLGLVTIGDSAIKFNLEARHLTAASRTTISQISFNNPLLEQKLAQYQLRCLKQGVPDVLIVGSSRALRGVDPGELRQGLIDRGYPNATIYNFGINGATAQVVDLILRQLLTPEQLPKLVIWADGARAFNSGRIDRTYETIALSDRYRQLVPLSGLKNSDSSILQAQSAFQNTYQAIDTAIDRRFADISPAYHHRDRLKTWLQVKVPFVMQIADSSNAISSTDPSANINEREIDADGFLALELKFDPHTYYQKYNKVTGDSDGDYANFQLLGSQHRALQQTIELLANRKIPLVFVNVPLSDIYLDKVRRQHEATFEQYMQNLMDSNQLTFINMNNLLAQKYDLFSDPSHLNQFGATEVSRYLATTEGIPWQILK
ncbi:DUF1574 family protein [Chamaesiphon sp. VAR_48_metabat_135_sub]|uniref:DUF1574 family protein n=1 Tax=Chamaesiphon sp. VAR_48_metabat_135_sub TaxID=2964699 RepID=UPI00286D67D6|nr:DUF1574 family protein [Chamaesiphon sp. VAR_48_metabat_135_sub]